MPLLEIHLPVFNEELFLPRILDCIRKQTFTDFQVVVHDNGSTDQSHEIAVTASKEDKRISVRDYRLNTGIQAQGFRWRFGGDSKYVSCRSANDYVDNTYFEECIALLETNPTAALAYSHGTLMSQDGGKIGEPIDAERIDTRSCLDACERAITVMQKYGYSFPLYGVYRRTLLDKVRPVGWVYGSDHVFVCEVSLYGDVISTANRLDFRTVSRNELEFFPYGVRDWAHRSTEEYNRGIAETSPFSGISQLLPFTNLIYGHIEMFSFAKIYDVEKSRLIQEVARIICSRFGSFIEIEVANFLSILRRDFRHLQVDLANLPASIRLLRLGKIRAELHKLRFLPLEKPHEISALDRQLAELFQM